MRVENEGTPPVVKIGGAQMHFQNIELREDVRIDEVHLEGETIVLEAPASKESSGKVSAGEVQFRAVISEPNINLLLENNTPSDAPIRSLRITVLSGKVRVAGQFVKSVLSLPFTLEATPQIENGTRLWLDCSAFKAFFSMPAPVVEIIEQQLNQHVSIDLSRSPVPIHLEEVKCEPGRLTVRGRARVTWPPNAPTPTGKPFALTL